MAQQLYSTAHADSSKGPAGDTAPSLAFQMTPLFAKSTDF